MRPHSDHERSQPGHSTTTTRQRSACVLAGLTRSNARKSRRGSIARIRGKASSIEKSFACNRRRIQSEPDQGDSLKIAISAHRRRAFVPPLSESAPACAARGDDLNNMNAAPGKHVNTEKRGTRLLATSASSNPDHPISKSTNIMRHRHRNTSQENLHHRSRGHSATHHATDPIDANRSRSSLRQVPASRKRNAWDHQASSQTVLTATRPPHAWRLRSTWPSHETWPLPALRLTDHTTEANTIEASTSA